MGRTPLTELRKTQTRREVAEAAIELFMVHGYDAVSVEAIAEQAGVSERTFYRYFSTKDDVLSPIITENTAELVDLIAARPVAESLATAVHHAFAETNNGVDQARVRVLIGLQIAVPALRAQWLDDLRGIEEALIPVVVARTRLDQIQAHLTAAVIVAAIRVCIERSAHTDSPPLALDLADALGYVAAGATLWTQPPSPTPGTSRRAPRPALRRQKA